EDLAVHLRPLDLDRTTQHVLNDTHAFLRHLHADDVRFASGQTPFDVVRGQLEITVDAGIEPLRLARLADLVEFSGGTEAIEGMPPVNRLLHIALISRAPFGLPVRTVRPANIGTFVPLQPEPAQGAQNIRLRFAGTANLIRIFNTQDELAAVLSRKAQIEQRYIGSAHMGITGWRRSDTGSDSHEALSIRTKSGLAARAEPINRPALYADAARPTCPLLTRPVMPASYVGRTLHVATGKCHHLQPPTGDPRDST